MQMISRDLPDPDRRLLKLAMLALGVLAPRLYWPSGYSWDARMLALVIHYASAIMSE